MCVVNAFIWFVLIIFALIVSSSWMYDTVKKVADREAIARHEARRFQHHFSGSRETIPDLTRRGREKKL